MKSSCLVFAIALMMGRCLNAAEPASASPLPSQSPCCECVTHCCKLVPDVKQIKKTVYDVQEVPYCLKKLPPLCTLFHHRGCECELCAECQCPRYKKVLVKKEVVCKEICTTKCVVEEHRVPCPGQACQTCGK
jgi:hypothetical protein